jgi:hypothetical protein
LVSQLFNRLFDLFFFFFFINFLFYIFFIGQGSIFFCLML